MVLLVVFAVAFVVYSLQMNADLERKINPLENEERRLFGEFTQFKALDALLSIYFMSLGDFGDTGLYAEMPPG